MGEAAQAFVRILSRDIVETRLKEWAREYGGGRYEHLGFGGGEHVLAKLIKFGGFLPGASAPSSVSSITGADEVEKVVKRLNAGWPDHARVLRCDYFRPDMAMAGRLDMLRRAGTKISRAGYYSRLESAKLFVAGAL